MFDNFSRLFEFITQSTHLKKDHQVSRPEFHLSPPLFKMTSTNLWPVAPEMARPWILLRVSKFGGLVSGCLPPLPQDLQLLINCLLLSLKHLGMLRKSCFSWRFSVGVSQIFHKTSYEQHNIFKGTSPGKEFAFGMNCESLKFGYVLLWQTSF